MCQGTAGKGCDQRHCQDARLIRCDAGFCDQSGATTADPGYAPVDDAGSILCDGGATPALDDVRLGRGVAATARRREEASSRFRAFRLLRHDGRAEQDVLRQDGL